MKFTTTQSEFAKAIAVAAKALMKRPTHPVMEYFLIESNGTVKSSNLQTFVEQRFFAEEETHGTGLIKAKMLVDLVKSIPKGELTLEVTEKNALLISKGNSYKLESWEEVEDFPEIPNCDFGFDARMTIPTKDFLEGIKRTAYAAAADITKQILTGIYIKNSSDSLQFYATDGHRVASANFLPIVDSGDIEVVIPATVLVDVEKVLAKTKEEYVELTINSGIVQIVCGEFNIKTRLLEGMYPKIDSLIPRNFAIMMGCDRALLLESLQQLSLYAPFKREKQDSRNIVGFNIRKDLSCVYVPSSEGSDEYVKQSFDTCLIGKDTDIAFNIFYLIDALKNMPGTQATIHMNNELSTVCVTNVATPPHSARNMAIVMPLQVRKK